MFLLLVSFLEQWQWDFVMYIPFAHMTLRDGFIGKYKDDNVWMKAALFHLFLH